jgi:ribonuclease P protein component
MTAPAAGFRLPRAHRVRKRPDFVRVQGSSVRVTTRHLLLLLAPAPSEVTRLGVVASRKVGPAVVRNRAKRLVREAFRLHPGVFPAGIDIVVVVRPGTHLVHTADLEAELEGITGVLARRARDLLARARSTVGPT